jgi:hypothetical protein
MTCAKCGQPDESTFVYDGLGMRARMQKSGLRTYFMYGLDGQLLLEDTPLTSDSKSEIKEYVYVHGKQVGTKVITRPQTLPWLPAVLDLLLD